MLCLQRMGFDVAILSDAKDAAALVINDSRNLLTLLQKENPIVLSMGLIISQNCLAVN